ncbi:hypothetical protein SK571_00535 [Lentzea sp. BCCO 10_0798]|uniref:HNH endonuclease n=1 Tax=Lentzea kristufekii TaxID=3095430 RepID=A0ABU4THY1_9PSEU|nr:hypothetical protein [Lentzea sp. BCCO 10_0798]MDX8047853.1 hypothetical protein [Lentzea sp. BCCO 10_0798]
MPKEKGRLGHAATRVDSDIGQKYQKIASLVPVIEHLRHGLDSQPDYAGMSGALDEAQDELVLDIWESPTESPIRLSLLFSTTLGAPVEVHEMSVHRYMPWIPPEVVKIRVCSISLSRGLVALVDEDDYAVVAQFNWQASLDQSPMASRRIYGDGRSYTTELMHNVIMNPPAGTRVEHVDGDRLNNTRANLRLVQIEVPVTQEFESTP